jgi:hypothetical protein
LDWQANPVLTTVNTTAYPVKMIEFPAVTICGQGMSDDVISAAMFKQFFQFVAQKNLTNTINPLRAQELIYIKESSQCIVEITFSVKNKRNKNGISKKLNTKKAGKCNH